jgi:hypothetical protein
MESDVTMTLPSTCICLHHYWGLSHLNTPSRETLKEKQNKNQTKTIQKVTCSAPDHYGFSATICNTSTRGTFQNGLRQRTKLKQWCGEQF